MSLKFPMSYYWSRYALSNLLQNLLVAASLAALLAFAVFPHSTATQDRDRIILLGLGVPSLVLALYRYIILKRYDKGHRSLGVVVSAVLLLMFGPYAAERDLHRAIGYCSSLISHVEQYRTERGYYPSNAADKIYKRPKHLWFTKRGCQYKRLGRHEMSLNFRHPKLEGVVFYRSQEPGWKVKTESGTSALVLRTASRKDATRLGQL